MTTVQLTKYGYSGQLSLLSPGPYGNDIGLLYFDVYFQTQQIVRFKIYDPKNERWEVPFTNQLPTATSKPNILDYDVKFTANPFGFTVVRIATGEILFNSSPSTGCPTNGLIFEDYYLELSTSFTVSNPNLYGLGERAAPLRLNNSMTYTLFAKDQGTASTENINLYGSHPFYMQLLPNGNANGVFMLNSNAMDVVLQPNSLTYKIVGGIIDLFIFTGPTPVSVVQQYAQLIGNPHIPPYWSLGWHQCRWGYHTVEQTEQVVANYSKYGIPLETMWNDIDYMDAYKDFTVDPVNFPQTLMFNFVNSLHENHQHYIMIVDPGIHNEEGYAPYDDLMTLGSFITTDQGQPLIGKVWPGSTIFPDFLDQKAWDFWQQQLQNYHDMVPFDGVWIDMNEVSNFCDGDCSDSNSKSGKMMSMFGSFDPNNPPYLPGGVSLDQHTINLTAVQNGNISVYNSHSLYGYTEGMATVDAVHQILGTRTTVISRSTFPGTGSHNGHWLGDNESSYNDLYLSIPGMLNMNIFGIPLVGADICGFNKDSNSDLCGRWMQLGNFYPFSRNHNSFNSIPQEPYVWGQAVIDVSINAINLKYTLLPYYYTLFYLANTQGLPVMRPLFMEYPTDANTYAIDTQFLVGPSLLVSPVLTANTTTVTAYFPTDTWYDFFTGSPVAQVGKSQVLPAPFDVINVHIRGGSILALQPTQSYVPGEGEIPITTHVARTLPFTINVALDSTGSAQGQLFLDDGISLDTIENGQYTVIDLQAYYDSTLGQYAFESSVSFAGSYLSNATISTVVIFGVSEPVSNVYVDGTPSTAYTYTAEYQSLSINNLVQSITSTNLITWN
ncbi:alpha-glucosidase [Cavenderia fasciculata]|uniref:Maltase n=1 Tax=Cavenderia fasciculata TaxID=261658 RepID=F4QCJ4_CACFS|nr:alpha-glucosidase [Cavenderia fasciculata]EGG14422.1 alpha-glucosidase [Cavenderia fasciculata]|eukprot:XP_004353831.1 alpha-glucosidase [Cavenderia fasciculata]